MTTDSGNPFAGFLDDYYAECDEHLTLARQSLLALESPDAESARASIDELLRSFHSLKGLSAMVGVNEVTRMAHLMEEYLRDLQTIRSHPAPAGLDALATGVEAIEQVVSARRKGEPIPDISSVLQTLTVMVSEDQLDANPAQVAPASAAGSSWQFSFLPSVELAERGINVTTVREKLRDLGSVVQATPRALPGGGIAFDFAVATDKTAAEIEHLILPGMTFRLADEPVAQPVVGPDLLATEALPSAAAGSFVRVEMHKLDELMRMIGELVISRAHFDEALRVLEQKVPGNEFRVLKEVNTRIARQLRGFREAVMHVRMVPIRQIFERMRFVVRGLERDTQKRVQLEIRGQDTEIDKLIVDRMMDPLLHLVRNAVSHGIDKAGTLMISARTAGQKVIIEVQDDGRGVDLDRVTAKARSTGAIEPHESVDEAALLDIICAPGFSTRDKADLISGRGVGMDVVHSTIEELGGLLTMETAAGKGTKFTIALPLTLVILDALLVTSDAYRFAVPQSGVREIVAVGTSEMRHLENNRLIPYRGGVLPVIPVSDLLRFDRDGTGGSSDAPKRERVHVLVIGTATKSVGLVVDKVTGQREIVVRSISDPHLRIPGIIGATELGDGKPVLIVDAEALVRLGARREIRV